MIGYLFLLSVALWHHKHAMLKIACAHKRLVIGQKISHPSINISFQFRNPF